MLTPAKAQDNIMKDEIRKIIHHEISQKNVVKFSLIYVPPALFGNKTVKNLTITEVLWLIWICVREVFDAQTLWLCFDFVRNFIFFLEMKKN